MPDETGPIDSPPAPPICPVCGKRHAPNTPHPRTDPPVEGGD